MKNRFASALAAGILGGLIAATPIAAETGNEVLLQGFHWNAYQGGQWYNTLNSQADQLDAAGFDMVWLPPPSKTADNAGYLPNQWYDLNAFYGTQTALTTVINSFHARGISVVADIVINHRVGTTNWADFTNPAFPNNDRAICAGDEYCCETGAADTGEGFGAARDLDHTWVETQNTTKAWMNWLKGTIGFDGWRYDFVKGFGGTYIKTYNDATSPVISIGEFFDYDRQKVVDWINATQSSSRAFDFPTRNLLYLATVNNEYWRLNDGTGKAGGVIGWWAAKSVTFIENHDLEEARGGANGPAFPTDKTMQGYAYILTHPGIPTVFYNDWNSSSKNEINALIAIRKAQGIRDTSTLAIQVADSTKYAAIVNGNTAVKIGPGAWTPSGTWTLAASGSNYAVWTTTTGPTPTPGPSPTPSPTPAPAVSLSPNPPVRNATVTINYNAAGRSLAGATTVKIHLGKNNWASFISPDPSMTNVGTNLWRYTYTVPSDATQIDMVFNNGGSTWDNNGGADWHFTTVAGATPTPSPSPTPSPTPSPSPSPSPSPTASPTATPTATPTPSPSPTAVPTSTPTGTPTATPTPIPGRVALSLSKPVKNELVKVIYDKRGGPLASASTIILHKGINAWAGVEAPDVTMTLNAATGFYEYTYRVASTANQIDLVFTNGTIWDNNSGADWHFTTSRGAVSPAKPKKGQTVSVSYNPAGGPLASATTILLHKGINNWAGVEAPDVTMTRDSFGIWKYSYTVQSTATQIDMVFTNGTGTWDNNGGADWHFVTE